MISFSNVFTRPTVNGTRSRPKPTKFIFIHFLRPGVRANDKIKTEANKKGEKVSTKRVPPGPKGSKTIKPSETTVETFAPLHFVAFNF